MSQAACLQTPDANQCFFIAVISHLCSRDSRTFRFLFVLCCSFFFLAAAAALNTLVVTPSRFPSGPISGVVYRRTHASLLHYSGAQEAADAPEGQKENTERNNDSGVLSWSTLPLTYRHRRECGKAQTRVLSLSPLLSSPVINPCISAVRR